MKKRGKYGISMYSFPLSANPKKDSNLLQKLETLKDASKREEVALRLIQDLAKRS
ncbi:MAG: hypothetical protein QW607_10670 [Desulfurococcaceae archaeon]